MENSIETKKKKGEFWRVVKFVLFSASAGIIEFVSFTLLNEFTGWTYWPCYLIALVLSVLWNFTLNRKFTFMSATNVPKAMLLVFLYYCAFTPITTILGQHLTDGINLSGFLGQFSTEGLHWNEYIVTIINMLLNLITEYLFDRFVVFRNTIDTNDIAQKQAAREEAVSE